jgi:Fur family transcriptional regulator, peroxide stress response regulator
VQDETAIVAVEAPFAVPLVDQATGEVLDRHLVGTLDLVERAPNGGVVVVDLKTAARKYTDLQVEASLQLSIYSYATAMNGLADEQDLRLRFDVLTKTKTPELHRYWTTRYRAANVRLYRLAAEVLGAIEAGAFPPRVGWHCADCPFRAGAGRGDESNPREQPESSRPRRDRGERAAPPLRECRWCRVRLPTPDSFDGPDDLHPDDVDASHRFLTLRASSRTVPIVWARLMEMRIIPEMRVGRAAHAAHPPGVESAEVALRDRGFRLTAPRHAVLEVVRGIKTHPTAEEVHRLVIRRAPGVSLGTVYRNLRLLVDAGLLGELPGPRARFDANTRVHHHFTCLRCGRIADVEAPVAEPHLRALSKRVETRTGLAITHLRIDFFGRCGECQVQGRARPGRRRSAADVSARATHPSAR